MTFRELVDKEHKEVKERMMKETSGTYVLLYLLNGFVLFIMCMFGFTMHKEDGYMMFIFSCMIFMTLVMWERYISCVREKNKNVNIFVKYKYIPIDMKQLIKAKMVVFIRFTRIPIILGQIFAILIRIWNPDNEKQDNIWITFMPLYIGVVLYIYEYVYMIVKSKKV